MSAEFIEKIIPHIRSLYPKANLKPTHIAENVKLLSTSFVKSEQIKGYLNETDQYLAYLLYFMPINMLKLPYMLDKIDFSQRNALRILDCGTGTGTFTFAAISYFSSRYPGVPVDITLSDEAVSHVESTRRLISSMQEAGDIPVNISFDYLVSGIADMKPTKIYDIIILGNVINEIDTSKYREINRVTDSLLARDGYVIMIEPALRELSRKALTYRDVAIGEGFYPVFPCVQTGAEAAPCPALAGNEWCHQAHSIDKSRWISGIDKFTGFIKDDVRYTGIIFSRTPVIDPPDSWRVVSELLVEKGLSKAYLCQDNRRLLFRRLNKTKSRTNIAWSKIDKGYKLKITNALPETKGFGIVDESGVGIVG